MKKKLKDMDQRSALGIVLKTLGKIKNKHLQEWTFESTYHTEDFPSSFHMEKVSIRTGAVMHVLTIHAFEKPKKKSTKPPKS